MLTPALPYRERADLTSSHIAKRLFELMEEKKTNLALSADVTHAEELLKLAEQVGPEIVLLKTHIDIINDFSAELTHSLKKIAEKNHFLLFEDRKFADIGQTVKYQYAEGLFRIADWADIVNAHSIPGIGIVQGLAEVGRKKNRGLLLIAELSSINNFIDQEYTAKTVKLAEQFGDFVFGFITQRALSPDPRWIYMTPGIQLASGRDRLGQQYVTPEKAIIENGSDIIIVGRGIIQAKDPKLEAKKYQEKGWQSYLTKLIK